MDDKVFNLSRSISSSRSKIIKAEQISSTKIGHILAKQPPQDSVCITRRPLVSIVIRAETEATQSSIGMMQNLVFTQCHSSEKHTLPVQRSAFIWATFLVSRYYYDNTLSLFSTPTSFSGEVKASWTVSQQHLLKSLIV